MSCFNSSKPFIISPVLFLILCTFSVPNCIVLLRSLCHRKLHLSSVFLMGFFSNFLFFSMSRGLACCINPQPGGPGDFWSRCSSSSPWYASIKLQGSSASLVHPRYFISPVPTISGEHSPIRHPGRHPIED